jgi:uncharacterized cupin superfamily protein
MASAATDTRIKVERPTEERLKTLGVARWPIWTKEPSTFDWEYDEQESCYFLEGEVTVTTDQGRVTIGPGDLVTFPKGLSCSWHVTKPIRKHYRFS